MHTGRAITYSHWSFHCIQAESDHHVRDAYNYMTVQTDIAMPKRQIKVVQDAKRQAAWAAAINNTVASIRGNNMDCRVLDLGAGAGKSASAIQLGCVGVVLLVYLCNNVCAALLDPLTKVSTVVVLGPWKTSGPVLHCYILSSKVVVLCHCNS